MYCQLGPKGKSGNWFLKTYPLWKRSLHHCLIKSHNFWMQSQWLLIFPFYRRNDGWCSQCWYKERPELNSQTSYPVAIPLYQNGILLPKQVVPLEDSSVHGGFDTPEKHSNTEKTVVHSFPWCHMPAVPELDTAKLLYKVSLRAHAWETPVPVA